MKAHLELYDLQISGFYDSPVVDASPYFSWKMSAYSSDEKSVEQTSYRIIVEDGNHTVWDSGIVASKLHSFIPYCGEELKPCTEYACSVYATDNNQRTASIKGSFETGLISAKNWKAKWIEGDIERTETSLAPFWNCKPPVRFSKKFPAKSNIARARLYASCHGIYTAAINGAPVDISSFAPEHTVYDKLQYYQTYDVSALLGNGENTLEMYVGDGWYLCPQTKQEINGFTGNPGAIFQLEILYSDGEKQLVCSDGTETSNIGNIVYSDIYLGEKQDFTLHSHEESTVHTADFPLVNLCAQLTPPVKEHQLLCGKWISTPNGDNVLDFGQIITGRLRADISLPYGKTISFEYFETLGQDGNYKNTMLAPQRDIFVSAGEKIQYEAQFTYHGFRYVRVSGCSKDNLQNIRAVALSSQKRSLCSFECSNKKLNQLMSNILWSQVNNTLSIPTDCPTREKAGFTGDIQIYAKTSMFLQEMTPFLTGYLRNLSEAQGENGAVPIVVPETAPYRRLMQKNAADFDDTYPAGVAGWSDAAVIVPYEMYKMTGNKQILLQQYSSMKKWCGYIISAMGKPSSLSSTFPDEDKHIWNTGFHFGEWLIPSKEATTHKEACANSAFYTAPIFGYISLRYMQEISEILCMEDDAEYYGEKAKATKSAIQRTLIRDGKFISENMGAYVLMLAFGLVPENLVKAFADKLVSLIEDNCGCLDTGFLATPYILDVLTNTGHAEVALSLLFNEKMPSWLWEVNHDATAIWESWNAIEPDGKVNITSFDHYAFGCVGAWIVENILGIKALKPGFEEIQIAPLEKTGLDFCKGSYECVHGKISVENDCSQLKISIPCGAKAHVIWHGKEWRVGSGEYEFSD